MMDDANANQTTTLARSPGPTEPVAQAGWRWRSRPGSVERGEISVLAIVETLAAMTIAVLIAVKYGTVKHIAVGACLAPFMLLQTERSETTGLNLYSPIFEGFFRKMGSPRRSPGFNSPKSMFYACLVPNVLITIIVLGPHIVRWLATVACCARHPLLAVRAIPQNWRRVVFHVDAFTMPELLPGIERVQSPSRLSGFRVSRLLPFAWSHKSSVGLGAIGGIAIFIYAPTMTYRWSLKATSLIYAPLLWIVWTTFKPLGLRQRLALIRRSPLSKIIVAYSCLVALGLIAKVYLYATWNGFATWFNSTWAQTLAMFVRPAEIPLWQVAMFVNALLALGLFVLAGHALVRYEVEAPWHEGWVKGLVKSLTFVRCTLTVYVIACNLYLLVTTASLVNLPRIKPVLFPWSA